MTTPSAAAALASSWRRIAEWVVPTIAVAVVVAAPLVLWARLPEPMAVHWGTGGQPDGALPRLADAFTLGLAAAVVGFGPLLAAQLRMPRGQARILIAAALGSSGLFVMLRIVTLRANLDVASWTDAGELTGPTLLAAFGVAALLAGVGAWLAGDRPNVAPPTTAAMPVQPNADETVVWSGSATARIGLLLPLGLLAAAALCAWLVPGTARVVLLIVLPLVALATSTLGQTRVVVGPQGLSVGLGWLGWPRLRVPITDVAAVSVEELAPMSYGGWGLRIVPGATAVVIRAGAAIRVERASGRVFVVTVDDAARGAGVLQANARSTPAAA